VGRLTPTSALSLSHTHTHIPVLGNAREGAECLETFCTGLMVVQIVFEYSQYQLHHSVLGLHAQGHSLLAADTRDDDEGVLPDLRLHVSEYVSVSE
jgi:hypothetical protein